LPGAAAVTTAAGASAKRRALVEVGGVVECGVAKTFHQEIDTHAQSFFGTSAAAPAVVSLAPAAVNAVLH
jgi:hypothetical protein